MSKKSGYPYDVLGNIVIVKFPEKTALNEKRKFANKILKQKSVKTVLEKKGKVKGRLRKIQTSYVAGEKTKEVCYKENGCVFRFNVDSTYFSPRLSGERKEIAEKVKKGEDVLVMFSGVAPYGIVIGKISKVEKVLCVEINREASKYAKLNVELNKLKDKVEIVQGDVKKVAQKFSRQKMKFDVIVMPRPQLKDSFLKQAFSLSKGGKKGTRIFYYDFCKQEEIHLVEEKIMREAKDSGKKIKIVRKKTAGEIAPYKFRMRFDLKVL